MCVYFLHVHKLTKLKCQISVFHIIECDTPRSMEEEEEASDIDTLDEKEKRPVDKAVVAAGMKRLAFLIDSCNPGMVPDPEFLAAALDLVSAELLYL